MTDYQYTTEAIDQYYSGEDQWKVISNHNITPEESESALGQIQNVNIVKSDNGKVISYNFQAKENVTPDIEESINSNASPNIRSFEIPSNSGIETVTSEAGETVKHMTFKSGLSKAGNFVFGQIVPAIGAVATGITLGKTIDKLLYNTNPDFWDEHGMSTLDPDTWGDIIGTDTAGGRVLNTILGTTPEGKTQAYIDQNALAYMALYLQNKGVFAESESKSPVNIDNDTYKDIISEHYNLEKTKLYRYSGSFNYRRFTFTISNNANPVYYFWIKNDNTYYNGMQPYFASKTNFTLKVSYFDDTNTYDRTSEAVQNTLNNKTFYYLGSLIGSFNGFYVFSTLLDNSLVSYIYDNKNNEVISGVYTSGFYHPYDSILYYMLVYGDVASTSDIEGIGTQDGAKTPSLSDDSSVEDVLNALKEQFPELWNKAVEQDVVQPDGSVETYVYVPVAMPEIDPEGNPVSSSSTQKDPQIDPADDPDPLIDLISKIIQRDPPVNPPDIGSGITPIVPSSSGSASALYMIYNPTLAQINSFGAWLWSDNFVDQIKKLFNDPMQAIIGLHKVYATPATGGAQTIKVGYLDSGVSAKVVSNQYTTIDCGTVRLSEQFHNVFDYSPYTDVNLYLPFIGIVNISVSDVMRSSIHIVYHVDVLSGACLAEVKVTRDSAGGTLYQYAGNASVTLPISSGSYMGIVSAVAGVAGGIAGTIASGGSALPLLASSAGAMFNAHTRVEHSGGFSGNAGAMGGKIPYLIISRPQTEMADGFENYIGYPSNFTATIGTCTGFIKVIECHLENTTATNSELNEINTMLQEGVIV